MDVTHTLGVHKSSSTGALQRSSKFFASCFVFNTTHFSILGIISAMNFNFDDLILVGKIMNISRTLD